jgi:hypothetical protein
MQELGVQFAPTMLDLLFLVLDLKKCRLSHESVAVNVFQRNIQKGEEREFAGDVARAMNGSQHQRQSSMPEHGVLSVRQDWVSVFVGEYLKKFLAKHFQKLDQGG